MARGRTPGRAAGQVTAQVIGALLEEGAHVVKRAGAVAAPWIAWPIVLALGVFQWLLWRGPGSASIVAAAGLALAAMDVYLTRNRKTIVGRYAAAATTLAVAAWIAWVALVGLGLHGPLQAWAMGGFILCLAWSKWLTIRPDSETHGSVADLFGKHAIRSGQPRLKVSSTQTGERSVSGDLKLPPGTVASDLTKVPRYLEGAAGLPPGALQITPHDEDGGKAKFSLSNPLLIRKPQPWPGPSAPGASIAEPIVPSIYQDGTPCRYTVTNHHLKLAGMTGAGKSRGWGWCEVAETVTRRDAGVLAIDLTKGRQTVGPLKPALHRCETTAGGAITLLDAVHRMIRPRTDWLADKGLGEWREGCGLTHWTVLVEEAPDTFEELDNADLMEMWIKDVKAARSAGIRWLISLQRPDWTQMPTLARGQMASCCFGLGQDSDDKFGLSAYQFDHCEPRPSIWADTYPGMHYLDHGQIGTDRKAMPLRTWYWGDNNDLMIAHCERYTAASRPMDGLSADMLGPIRVPNPKPPPEQPRPQARPSVTLTDPAPPADDDDAALVLSDPAANLTAMMAAAQGHGLHAVDDDNEPAEGEIVDTNVTMSQADALNLPIDPAAGPRITFRPPAAPLGKLTPEQADRALREQINAWLSDGKTNFTVTDAVEVLEVTARSRSWLYDRVAVLEGEGVLRKAGFASGWTIHQPANVEAA